MKLMQICILLTLSTSLFANDYKALQKKYNTLESKYQQLEKRLAHLEKLLGGTPASQTAQKQTKKRKPVNTTGIIRVSANTLSREYKKNSVATELKYSKAPIIVSGEVSRIDRSPLMENVYITLKTARFTPIRCFFSESQIEEIATLSKGQQISIKGHYENSLMGVDIQESVLVD